MDVRRRGAGLLAAALAFGLAASSPAPATEEIADADAYVRDLGDVGAVVRWLETEGQRIGAVQALVVLDAITFAPPDGESEFVAEHDYRTDLDAWLAGLGRWTATTGLAVRATTSWNPRTIRVGPEGWEDRLRDLLALRDWDAARPTTVEPALTWMKRLLVRTEDGVPSAAPEDPRMVVLVAGRLTPERWVPPGQAASAQFGWRSKLLPVGRYWDPDEIAAAMQPAGARLYVVAPEACFGDVEVPDPLPAFPWVARPLRLDDRPRNLLEPGGPRVAGPPAPGGGPFLPGAPGGRTEEEWRALLDLLLRASIPDPEERRRRIDEMLAGLGGAGGDPVHVGLDAGDGGDLRFSSAFPSFFPWPIHDHVPSGYGWWPYARTCAATGGRYLFYPLDAPVLLDVCVADPDLLASLAPSLPTTTGWLSHCEGDPALDAIAKAAARVAAVEPLLAAAPPAFASTKPLRLEDDHLPFRFALEDLPWGDRATLRNEAQRIREERVPAYEDAVRRVEKAIAAVEGGRDRLSSPRSVAHLHLVRFELSMSLFHLASLELALSAYEPVGRADARPDVVCEPTIRLSDVLDAYDGRTLSPEDEKVYPRRAPLGGIVGQGNVLDIPADDPNYRAKRSLARVLARLDRRLRAPALDLVRAAEKVHERYGFTAWDWSVYYADAFTIHLR